MDLRGHLLQLARYHAWASQVLIDALAPFPDPHYRRPCGLFFGSIHGTLNHLLAVDRLWFGRLCGEPSMVAALDQELYVRRAELAEALMAQATSWADLVEGLDSGRLAAELEYLDLGGTPSRLPYAGVLAHVFNHGTHHRGQITAAMTAQGYPPPEIDLFYFLRPQPAQPVLESA